MHRSSKSFVLGLFALILFIGLGVPCQEKRDSTTVQVPRKTLFDKLITLGDYQFVHSDITYRHIELTPEPISLEHKKLFHFKDKISSADIISRMNNEGYRPATITELMVYGASQEHWYNMSIVALGSVIDSGGYRQVGVVDGCGSRKILSLNYFQETWMDINQDWRGGGYYFLAFTK